MSDKAKYYVTTPIFYPNGVPHIGHAYTAIATDVLARFQRLDGKDVMFLTGTDEHGQKMQQTAEQEGIATIELADRNSTVFRQMVEKLNCSHDDFIRTTEERHKKTCQELWRRMETNGDIYLGKYNGWYSVRQEAFFEEKETTVGDDGVRREPLGSPVEWVEEESYFFRLSAYQEPLLALYRDQPDFVGPNTRRNEVTSFVKSGLRDLSVSRTTFDWGIKVPGDEAHVMYVWVDALTNYVSATGWPDTNERNDFWPANVHVIGKDIVRFHAVYWPAFLMSAGLELPKRVFAHGFLFNKGEKMSKSVGNVVDPFQMIEHYGCDQVRYFFMREVPFGQDGSYSHQSIVNRINADLANDLGNLAQRSLSMVYKNLEGRVEAPANLLPQDEALLAQTDSLLTNVREAMDRQRIHIALNAIWDVVGNANRYFAGEEPWVLKKTDPARMAAVLYVTGEVVRQVAILTQPFMPQSAEKLLDLLQIPADDRSFASLGDSNRWPSGTVISKPEAIFPRHVEVET